MTELIDSGEDESELQKYDYITLLEMYENRVKRNCSVKMNCTLTIGNYMFTMNNQ